MQEDFDIQSGSADNNIEVNGNNVKEVKKKNRTLQYYKFLFYSLKTEIKLHDFVKLIRNSNMAEISIWFLSLILYCCSPEKITKTPNTEGGEEEEDEEESKTYKNIFIFFHILHVLRAFLGIFLVHTFPKSYHVMQSLESNSDKKLEKTLFNDLIRETIFFNVTEKIKPKKIPIIIYLMATAINFVFDAVDFLCILTGLSEAKNENKVILLTYLIMALLYMILDLSYIFWTAQLKYVFPKEYLAPIDAVFNGLVDRAMVKFKIRKPKTDVIAEDRAQNSNQPYVKSTANGGVNILENIFSDFGIYSKTNSKIEAQNNPQVVKEKQEVREVYVDNNQYLPRSEDNIIENKLDE